MNATFRRNYLYKLIGSNKPIRYSHFDRKDKQYVFHSGAYRSARSVDLKVPKYFLANFQQMITKDRWVGDPKETVK